MTNARVLQRPDYQTPLAEIFEAGAWRTINVACRPEGLYLRASGLRDGFLLPYSSAYIAAAQLAAERARQEKRHLTKSRRVKR